MSVLQVLLNQRHVLPCDGQSRVTQQLLQGEGVPTISEKFLRC